MSRLSHVGGDGRARMVDVSAKDQTRRHAVAEATVRITPAIAEAIAAQTVGKGDVLRIAEIAGVMAAKRTADLIPLCHPLPLDQAIVTATVDGAAVRIRAEARTTGRTGVEMEAMTAAAIAALTLYDMVKSMDREVSIEAVRLLAKSGGKSGDWRRDGQ